MFIDVDTFARVWVEAGFLLAAATVTTVSLFLSCLPRGYIPETISQLILYGKTASNRQRTILDVPKSWFTHFYMLGCLAVSWVWIETFVIKRQTTRSPRATLVLFLFTVQVLRRLYECLFIHIFSARGTIHIAQYLIGMGHYMGISFLLRKLVIQSSVGSDLQPLFSPSTIGAVSCFFVISFAQHRTHLVLRFLRVNTKRKSHLHYPPPPTGLFRFVLCPNYTCEILLYASILCVLRGDPSWGCVVFWVVANQLLSGHLSLRWYRKAFPAHVGSRAAVIPFLV